MPKIKQTLRAIAAQLRQIPKKYAISTAVLIIGGVLYSAAFMIEKPVVFSYAGQTCVNRLTLLPTAQRQVLPAAYTAVPTNVIKIADWPIVARTVCFTPVQAPQSGVSKVSLAPFGGLIARQTFAVSTPQPVTADVKVLADAIPVSKPLNLRLSSSDTVFTYSLEINNKKASCPLIGVVLVCKIESLGLAQSKTYRAALLREFNNTTVQTIIRKEIKTLSATAVTGTSVKQDEIIYSKPTKLSVNTDKKLIAANASIYQIEGGKRTKVPSLLRVTRTGYEIALSEQLQRSKKYELITEKVEAHDGSGLIVPHTLRFSTSGGPKVTGVNVGATGVPLTASIIVSFDQALSTKQDVTPYLKLAGGVRLVAKQDNQLVFAVNDVSKCTDFTITLTNDLQSQYDIGGHSAYNYTGRTVCHTVGTIGTSVQGRPIYAYYFGSGTTKLLYTGAIHGDEISTKLLMDRWIQELEAKARAIPSHITVVVIPTINPDGFARGMRTNANNVDLNRNFATVDWKKDITTVTNRPFPGGGGESAMSEPETKSIASLVQSLRPKIVVSYHSIGGVVAANQAGSSSAFAATYSQLSGYGNVTGQSSATFEYAISGTADDWYAERAGVASLLVELGSHSYHQFERNQAAMWAMIHS